MWKGSPAPGSKMPVVSVRAVVQSQATAPSLPSMPGGSSCASDLGFVLKSGRGRMHYWRHCKFALVGVPQGYLQLQVLEGWTGVLSRFVNTCTRKWWGFIIFVFDYTAIS
eukprot:1162146-Pelagomonas_calceolata.AAC.8